MLEGFPTPGATAAAVERCEQEARAGLRRELVLQCGHVRPRARVHLGADRQERRQLAGVPAGSTLIVIVYPPFVSRASLLDLGIVPYREALDRQRSLAAAVAEGEIPDTVVLVEHPPVITTGRRTDEATELHIPEGAAVELVETDRGGKSTYHAPGQLVCYPILDLHRHGKDVRRYVRDLEQAILQTLASFELARDHDRGPDGRLAAAGRSPGAAEDRVDRSPRVAMGDDARLRPQRRSRPGPVHRVDHSLRARRRGLHLDGPRARAARCRDEVKPAAIAALAEVFGLELAALPGAAPVAALLASLFHRRGRRAVVTPRAA